MSLIAGAAFADISPHGPVALYGYPHTERIATGIHDPLRASVLMLKNGDVSLTLVSLDLLMIEPPFARALRAAVAAATGGPEDGVMISCTHTHSGPVTSRLIAWENDATIPPPDSDYLDSVRAHLVEAARNAMGAAAPAELVWTTADATGAGGNRLAAGGVTDPECGLLAVREKTTGNLMALALIYGMHPTILHEDSTLISSDFPHYTRLHLTEQAGRDVPILYHTAPCGNQSPRHYVHAQTFAEAERLGRQLGASAWRALEAIPPNAWMSDPALDGRLATVTLPRHPLRSHAKAERLLADCRERHARLQRQGEPRAEVRTAECAVFGAESAVALTQAGANGAQERRLRDYTPSDVQCLRIGNTAIIGLPGECFTEYSLEIKQRASRRVFTISLVNGDLQGYIVTPEAAAAGGYEAANAVFAPSAGRVLVEKALELAGGHPTGQESS